jgi:hypothetical protein
VAIRRRQRDVESLLHIVRDFSERQSQLFFLIATFVGTYTPPELHVLRDHELAEAARALAATFETSSRGVIYEHRAQSLPAERFAAALKPVLLEAGKQGGSAFERDAAVVLKRIAEASDDLRGDDPRTFIELVGRVIRKWGEAEPPGDEPADGPRLIVP